MSTGAFLEGCCHLALLQYETEHRYLPPLATQGARHLETQGAAWREARNLSHRPPSSGAVPTLRSMPHSAEGEAQVQSRSAAVSGTWAAAAPWVRGLLCRLGSSREAERQ